MGLTENKNMKKCDACGAEIAKNAKTCPQCGAKNKKPVYKRKWFIALMVIVALGIIGSIAGGGDDKDKVATTDTAQGQTEQAEPPKTPVAVTADTLIKDLDENALKAAETYKGQYLEISGRLSNIDSSGKYFSIRPDSGLSIIGIMCYITEDLKGQVADFKKGQNVKVIGTVKDVGEVMGYSIDVEKIL